jgi:hypothetical protein
LYSQRATLQVWEDGEEFASLDRAEKQCAERKALLEQRKKDLARRRKKATVSTQKKEKKEKASASGSKPGGTADDDDSGDDLDLDAILGPGVNLGASASAAASRIDPAAELDIVEGEESVNASIAALKREESILAETPAVRRVTKGAPEIRNQACQSRDVKSFPPQTASR